MVKPSDPGPVDLSGGSVLLAPLRQDDHQFLYWLATANEIGYRWRFRGVIPGFETFLQQLHANVFAQFVVRDRAEGDRIGHVIAYAADLRNGHAFIANVTTPERVGSRVGADAQTVFVQYLFDLWPFRKLYVEVPEFTYLALASWIGDDILIVEGQLSSHTFYKGEYWDQYILAITREAWDERPRPGRATRMVSATGASVPGLP